jgi:hypothetical protein
MDITTKIKIIQHFDARYGDIFEHKDFFEYNDLGVPLAMLVNAGLAKLDGRGMEVINDTYNRLCDELKIDKNKNFNSVNDFFHVAYFWYAPDS